MDLGIIEGSGDSEVFGKFIDAINANPSKHAIGDELKLQHLASQLPFIGHDVIFNMDPSVNVNRWNIAHNERKIVFENSKPYVLCNEKKTPLVSFHFSKPLNVFDRFGLEVKQLKNEYVEKLKS